MLYLCSCGFTAATATAFYKHLAASKESGAGHQLTQARFSDKHGKSDTKPDDGPQLSGQQAPGTASWVEEYLMVDQRDTTGQGSLPVSYTGAAAAAPGGHPPQHPPPLSTTDVLEDVPLRDLQGVSRGWGGLGRPRSSAVGRPPLPAARASAGTAVAAAQRTAEPPEPALDSDEVELVEHINGHRPSNSGASRDGGVGAATVAAGNPAGGAAGGGTATQAALRMSGSVVNAMVVGLSPWRWFGNGSPGGAGGAPGEGLAAEPFGGGLGEQAADPLGAPGGGEGAGGAEATWEVGPSGTAHAALLQRQAYAHAYPYAPDSPAGSLAPVHAVRDVLIWCNPWHTSRVFGAGLYAAVCVRQLAKGHELLQPSTAIFALCFLMLLRNVVRQAATTYRRNQQHQQGQGQGQEQQQAEAAAVAEAAEQEVCSSPSWSEREAAEVERRKAALLLQQRIEWVLQRVALGAARYGAALLVLGWGLLSGRRAITSALVAGLLWLGMVIGELRLISQPTFWLLCYVAAFTVPAAYYRCRPAMDAGVETALRFVARVLLSGSRAALAAAAGVAVVLLAALPLQFVLRASLAAAAAFGVLLWQTSREAAGAGVQVVRSAGGGAQGGGRLLPSGSQRREHGD